MRGELARINARSYMNRELNGNESHYTECSSLVMLKNLCRRLRCQKVSHWKEIAAVRGELVRLNARSTHGPSNPNKKSGESFPEVN